LSVALRGNLEDFGIADVFQLIGQQRKTGILELSGEGGRVELRFDRGRVVSAAPVRELAHEALGEMLVRCEALAPERLDALRRESAAAAQSIPVLAVERGWVDARTLQEIDDLLTRETFFAILRWREGAFDFRAQSVAHDRPFEALHGAEQILMDGLRMLDEWQSFAPQVPSEDLVFAPTGALADWEALAAEGAVAARTLERIFELVDRSSSVRQVIDRSRIGTFDAVRALAELQRAGLVVVAERSPRRVRVAPRGGASLRAPLRGLVATAVPLLLLLVAAVAALGRRAPEAALPGFPIPRDAWAAAKSAHATRGLRHAVDALHFRSGEWPRSLDGVPGAGSAMAGTGGAPYYYSRRDDGAVLLAPER
jgi:uncharacterized protein DUF4388